MVRDMDTHSKVNGENDTGRDGTRRQLTFWKEICSTTPTMVTNNYKKKPNRSIATFYPRILTRTSKKGIIRVMRSGGERR